MTMGPPATPEEPWPVVPAAGTWRVLMVQDGAADVRSTLQGDRRSATAGNCNDGGPAAPTPTPSSSSTASSSSSTTHPVSFFPPGSRLELASRWDPAGSRAEVGNPWDPAGRCRTDTQHSPAGIPMDPAPCPGGFQLGSRLHRAPAGSQESTVTSPRIHRVPRALIQSTLSDDQDEETARARQHS